jgi:hypothetical protein
MNSNEVWNENLNWMIEDASIRVTRLMSAANSWLWTAYSYPEVEPVVGE